MWLDTVVCCIFLIYLFEWTECFSNLFSAHTVIICVSVQSLLSAPGGPDEGLHQD